MDILRTWTASAAVYLLLNFVLGLVLPTGMDEVVLVCPLIAAMTAAVVHLYSIDCGPVRRTVAVLGAPLIFAVYYNFVILQWTNRAWTVSALGVLFQLVAAVLGAAVVFAAQRFYFRVEKTQ